MTQPEALRLADLLEQIDGQYWQVQDSAAAELRRLHAKCEALTEDTIEEMRRITELHRVTAQRDALLEKINGVLAAERSEGRGRGGFINTPPTREHQRRVAQAWQELHAAIKAVEEGK